jgi:hypothetical protein
MSKDYEQAKCRFQVFVSQKSGLSSIDLDIYRCYHGVIQVVKIKVEVE